MESDGNQSKYANARECCTGSVDYCCRCSLYLRYDEINDLGIRKG